MSRVTLAMNAGRSDDEPRVVHPVTFEEGEAVSNSFYLSGETVVGVLIPEGWTAANIQFETSIDNTNWYVVKSSTGALAQITGIDGAAAYAVPVGPLMQASWVRLISADSDGEDIDQEAGITLLVVCAQ